MAGALPQGLAALQHRVPGLGPMSGGILEPHNCLTSVGACSSACPLLMSSLG